MEIKQKLFKYIKTESYLDYPTYKVYALIKLGEVPFNKRIDVYMKEHLKAKKAIDDKYNELMMLAKENDRLKELSSENDRIKEVFEEEKKPKPKEKKKKRISNIEELREEDESE
jgi:hypothetical protein